LARWSCWPRVADNERTSSLAACNSHSKSVKQSTTMKKQIKGGEILFDRRDLPLVLAHTWHVVRRRRCLYAQTELPGRRGKYLHRMLVGRPGKDVDHRNRNGLDCRRRNLRTATRSQNLGNAARPSHNTSGAKGVCFHKPSGLWRARVTRQRKEYCIWSASKADATRNCRALRLRLFGEFSRH